MLDSFIRGVEQYGPMVALVVLITVVLGVFFGLLLMGEPKGHQKLRAGDRNEVSS